MESSAGGIAILDKKLNFGYKEELKEIAKLVIQGGNVEELLSKANIEELAPEKLTQLLAIIGLETLREIGRQQKIFTILTSNKGYSSYEEAGIDNILQDSEQFPMTISYQGKEFFFPTKDKNEYLAIELTNIERLKLGQLDEDDVLQEIETFLQKHNLIESVEQDSVVEDTSNETKGEVLGVIENNDCLHAFIKNNRGKTLTKEEFVQEYIKLFPGISEEDILKKFPLLQPEDRVTVMLKSDRHPYSLQIEVRDTDGKIKYSQSKTIN